MLTSDPLYRPDTTDLPPRMRSALADARKRLLPAIVQQRYVMARAAFEAKEYACGRQGFKVVMSGLSDPDISASTAQPPLSDLKVLAAGFHELALKAAAPAEAAAAAAAEPVLLAPPTPAAPAAPRIYGADDLNVVPPQTIRQVVPPFPGRVLLSGVATIDIVINETGTVDSVSMVTSLTPQYDRMALISRQELGVSAGDAQRQAGQVPQAAPADGRTRRAGAPALAHRPGTRLLLRAATRRVEDAHRGRNHSRRRR